MSPESLTPEGHTPAWLVGHGPIPAKTARKWLGHSDVVAEIRRLFTTPKGNQIVGLEAKSETFLMVYAPWCCYVMINAATSIARRTYRIQITGNPIEKMAPPVGITAPGDAPLATKQKKTGGG